MPLGSYFKGRGKKVMKSMANQYGKKRGKQVFYATANKQKSKGVRAVAPVRYG